MIHHPIRHRLITGTRTDDANELILRAYTFVDRHSEKNIRDAILANFPTNDYKWEIAMDEDFQWYAELSGEGLFMLRLSEPNLCL